MDRRKRLIDAINALYDSKTIEWYVDGYVHEYKWDGKTMYHRCSDSSNANPPEWRSEWKETSNSFSIFMTIGRLEVKNESS